MSQDIITDIALLMNHTRNMSGFTSDIEVVIRDVRIECEDASSCIISKKRDYEQHIDELNDTLREIENDEHSRESEERKAEIKEEIRYYKKRIGDTEGTDAAIEKCKYFLEIADEVLDLQNVLGMLYVAKAGEFVVDICDDPGNPEDSYPAFISLEDIKEARSLCETAKSLLTIDSFKEYVEEAEKTLKLCDLDENTKTRVSSIIFLIIHALISTVIYILLSPFGIGIFGLLLAPCAV